MKSPFLRIRLINLGGDEKLTTQIRSAFNDWGYEVFSGSGEGSDKCDVIITVGLPNSPEPYARIEINGKEKIIRGKDISEFATAVVAALTDRLVSSHQDPLTPSPN
ncbi:MAG: hypothetical protein Q7K28_01115 [Candidatus Wildermuthbacteria bacterium]|nr:hypothetical protein [Candidatus Wildermuthbacteria bacterium]